MNTHLLAPSEWTPEVAKDTAPIYEKLKHLIPAIEWPVVAPLLHTIHRLKQERKAVVMAHNYQTPNIFHGIADFTGDSLALAQQATRTDAEVIVLCSVHFMAETAKILNPDRTVLIPDLKAGCSLAESITGEDVRRLRQQYPGVPIVTYVNTSAEVKAESDVCCTSANAVEVVESLGAPRVLVIPDEYLAKYVATRTQVEVIPWQGRCMVHEQFRAEDIEGYRRQFPGVVVMAHPECSPEVIAAADATGSTAAMIRLVDEKRPRRVALITECSMSDNVAANFPDVEFVRPCTLCPHMKRITLQKIVDCLTYLQHPIHVDADVAARARLAVERMLAVGGRS